MNTEIELRIFALKRKIVNQFPSEGKEIIQCLDNFNFAGVWLISKERYDENKELFIEYCSTKKELKEICSSTH